MSKTIEEKVIEMRFDNKHFEQHTKESMSTLDKLKQKLQFKDVSKGFENITKSASKVDMKGMTGAIDTVGSRFSALEVIGVTALANITNSAVNAGKRIASALTIAPVKTGLSEYETQINATQTILANVGHKGYVLDDVNKALEELNEYADLTIYNFTEMTKNIGLFTNAGVDLYEAVDAIKGFSNAAAMAGTDSVRASGAMYQLSQAMSAGVVKLMDWRSLTTANIAGERFQDAVIETAKAHGIAIEEMIANEGNLQNTLHTGWLTADLMSEALNHYTLSTETMCEAEQEANRERLRSIGYTEEQIDKLFKLGTEATNAATKVKTFSQMWSVLQETAQSGWSRTWKILVGDFEQAKALFTPLTNFFQSIINTISYTRNYVLESALGKSFTGILDKVKSTSDGIKEVVNSVKNYSQVVDEIISGKWGNGQTRWDALAQAGYDWAHAQNLVNEKLGFSLRRATNYTEAQGELAGQQAKNTELTADYIVELSKLSDAELEAALGGKKQVKAFRELEAVAKKTGIPLKEFVRNIEQINGRYLLLNSFKNVGIALTDTFKAFGKAWNDVFHPGKSQKDILDEKAQGLFNIIAALHKFTAGIPKIYETVKGADGKEITQLTETGNKLVRTFKGVVAILDIFFTIVGGPIKLVLKLFSQLLGAFDLDILSVTARIGDAVVGFAELIDQLFDFTGISKALVPVVLRCGAAVHNWFESFKNSKFVTNFIDRLRSFRDSVASWIDGIKDAENIPQYIIQGLIKGLSRGAGIVIETMVELGKGLLKAICKVLGIKSPSKEFFKIGQHIISGLINGLRDGLLTVFNFIRGIGEKCVKIFKSIDFGKVLAAGIGIGLIIVVKNMVSAISRLTDVLENVTAPMKGVGDMLSGIGSYFADAGKAKKYEAMGKAIRNVALSIAILAGSVYLLSDIKPGKLWATIGAIAALAVIIGALAIVIAKIDKIKLPTKSGKNNNLSKVTLALLGLSASLYIMAAAMKKLSGIDADNMGVVVGGLIAMVVSIGLLFAAYGKTANRWTSGNMEQAGKMIKKIAVSLLLMVAVVKLAATLKPEEILKGIVFVTTFGIFAAALIAVSDKAGEHALGAGKMISKITWSLLLMIGVFKLAAMLKPEEIAKGISFLTTAGLFFTALIAVSYFAGEHAKKAGSMLLMASIALGIMVVVIKQISGLSDKEIQNGIKVLSALGVFSALLIGMSHFAGKEAIKAGTMLLLVSGALLILTGILFMLSKMDTKSLYPALGIVAVLETFFGGLMFVSQYAKDSIKTITTLTIVTALLIGAVIGLSFMNPAKLAAATASISAILLSLGALIASTNKMRISKNLTKTLVPLIGTVAILAGIIAAMSLIKNPQAVIASSIALSTLLTALATSLLIMSKIKNVSMKDMRVLAVLGLVVAELAAILGIMDHFNIEASIKSATALSILLLGMSGVLAILSFIGPMSTAAYPAMLALGVLIAGVGAVLAALGWIQTKYDLEGILNKGIPLLNKIGYALGSFVGNIIGGLSAGLTSGLPTIGENLTTFMENAEGFISGAKKVDKSVIDGVTSMTKAITSLVKAEFWSNVTTGLFSDGPLVEIGKELKEFGKYIKQYNESIDGIDINATVKSMVSASKLISAFSSVPGDGLFGTDGIDDFGRNLVTFGTKLKEYGTEVKDVDYESVEASIKPAKSLMSLADNVPKDGWTGTDGIDDFGSNIATFGYYLKQYGDDVKDVDYESISASIKPAKSLMSLADNVPKDGWHGLDGIDDFGSNISTFGYYLKQYATDVTGVDYTVIENSIGPAKSLLELGKLVSKIDDGDMGTDGIDDFGKNMTSFGKSLKKYSEKVANVNSTLISNSIDNAKKLIELFKSMSGVKSKNVKAFTEAIAEIGKSNIDKFAQAFSGSSDAATNTVIKLTGTMSTTIKSKADEFNKAGVALMNAFIKGIVSKKVTINTSVSDISKAGVSQARSYNDKFNSAGGYLVEGFANGIKNNKWRATNAGSALGRAALDAAKKALDEHSPSREAYKVGDFFGIGLVNGILDNASKVYDASRNVANYAKEGLSKAISKITDVINSDMDTQPTIRPVLDLSDVESGAGYLNSMFSSSSIGVNSNLNAISVGMRSRNQNGANNDVVSAIDNLRRDLGNITGTTNNYNVNGVTYDDGSNIAEAVGVLIRAAVLEGRV